DLRRRAQRSKAKSDFPIPGSPSSIASFPSAERPGHNQSSERASNWLTGSRETERSRVRNVDMGEFPLYPMRVALLACSLAGPYANGVRGRNTNLRIFGESREKKGRNLLSRRFSCGW